MEKNSKVRRTDDAVTNLELIFRDHFGSGFKRATASYRMAVASQPKGELITTGTSDGKLRLIDAAT